MTLRSLGGRGRLTLLFATALVAVGITAGSASAATNTFSNTGSIQIRDDDTAVPYPSTINVSGLAGNVQKVTATLHSFEHTYANDIAVLLVGPAGTNTLLMGHVGGSDETGFINLTFDQAALSSLNDTDTAVSGTFRPSQVASEVDPLAPPAPAGPGYSSDLGVFNGTPANGAWRLFIDDQVSVDFGVVQGGWSLNLTAPVNTLSAGKPKLNKNNGTAVVPVTVADAGKLTLSGKGVKTASASESKAVAGPGTVKLKVKPKGKTSSKLNSTGKATVKVKITFTPTGGTSNTVKKKIKLKKTLG